MKRKIIINLHESISYTQAKRVENLINSALSDDIEAVCKEVRKEHPELYRGQEELANCELYNIIQEVI